jgi:hypothetical protein
MPPYLLTLFPLHFASCHSGLAISSSQCHGDFGGDSGEEGDSELEHFFFFFFFLPHETMSLSISPVLFTLSPWTE